MSAVPDPSPSLRVRVLVAEDEAIIRLDLVEILESDGYEVVASTGRGDEAIELATALEPDVAVLDIEMPGATGIEAARAISATGVSAVVILSAFSQRDLIDDARSAGVMAYLVKPYQRADLAPALELALARYRELRESQGHADDLERRLGDRTTIERAKGRLIDRHGMSENDAFAYLRSAAMSDRCRMAEVAVKVLEGSLAP